LFGLRYSDDIGTVCFCDMLILRCYAVWKEVQVLIKLSKTCAFYIMNRLIPDYLSLARPCLATKGHKMKHILALLLVSFSTTSIAALNKWVDSEGKVHYSDSAPPDAKVTRVRTQTHEADDSQAEPAKGADTQKSIAEKELDEKRAQQQKNKEAQKANQAKEEAASKQKNCDSARSNLSTLENSPRISTYNEKGEREIMSEDNRSQLKEEARKAISKYCN
jgi:hypothetical protein